VRNSGKILWARAIGWSHDLPHVDQTPTLQYDANELTPPPNYCDETYLELSRATVNLRGIGVLIGTVTLLFCCGIALFLYRSFIVDGWQGDWAMNAFLVLSPPAAAWALFPYIKLDVVLPRDEPIRFNRLRRKVYFYQYRFDRIFIFSRKRWGVQPVAYNWDDVTAEVYRIYAPGHGGLIENVMLSVRNPETDEVIDRVFFTHTLHEGEAYWAIARLFMQQGPEALPKFVHPPRDWNDDDGLSHMHCLAPKVQWPTEIDLESRTAPATDEVC